ncbi:hypothetical protein R5576_15155 [Xanthomonas euvesicatoria]|nr:hypothetical protein R5576_15155 [Xanthomonas euvesicatoria]
MVQSLRRARRTLSKQSSDSLLSRGGRQRFSGLGGSKSRKRAGLEIACTKLPNGDQDCRVSGNVDALGFIGGQPTTSKAKEMRLKMTMKFRPAGEGWELVDVTDDGTSAG